MIENDTNPFIIREADNIIYVDFALIASFPEDVRSFKKRSVLLRLMSGGMVLAEIDARTKGIDVPDQHKRNPNLRLNLSYRFGLRFRADQHAIWAILTFNSKPYSCVIPWAALRAVTSHETRERVVF